jgi:uncharacterized protein (TIGR02271 family)
MSTVVGVYYNQQAAQAALNAIHAKGFRNSQLDILSLDDKSDGPKLHALHTKVPPSDANVYLAAVARGGSLVVADVDERDIDTVSEVLAAAGAVDIEERIADLKQVDAKLKLHDAVDKEAAPKIQLAAEQAAVSKQDVERRRLRVYTTLKEKAVEANVPLRDESVRVERRAINRNVALTDDLFKPQTIEMTEVDQEALVTKGAVITEEVLLTKDAIENLKTIRETLRHTDVAVEATESGRVIHKEGANIEFKDVKP